MTSKVKIYKTENILEKQPNTSIPKHIRDTTEILWPYDEKGRRAHDDESSDGRHTRKKTQRTTKRPVGKMPVKGT